MKEVIYTPWFARAAIERLDKYIRKLDVPPRVLEWGSGSSTVWIAKRASKVVSVEHTIKWYHITQERLIERDIHKHVKLVLALPDEKPGQTVYWDSEGRSFWSYCRSGSRAAEQYLNKAEIVFVDGRARVATVFDSARFIPKRGLLVLDDAERPRYAPAKKYLEEQGFKVQSFEKGSRSTEIWQKVENVGD